jgi:hypothetical protein
MMVPIHKKKLAESCKESFQFIKLIIPIHENIFSQIYINQKCCNDILCPTHF